MVERLRTEFLQWLAGISGEMEKLIQSDLERPPRYFFEQSSSEHVRTFYAKIDAWESVHGRLIAGLRRRLVQAEHLVREAEERFSSTRFLRFRLENWKIAGDVVGNVDLSDRASLTTGTGYITFRDSLKGRILEPDWNGLRQTVLDDVRRFRKRIEEQLPDLMLVGEGSSTAVATTSPTKREVDGAVALVGAVTPLRKALRTYIQRLGNDDGRSARIQRRSHWGTFDQPGRTLVETWHSREVVFRDEELRRLFAAVDLETTLHLLEHLPETEAAQWDTTVRTLDDGLAIFEARLRRTIHDEGPDEVDEDELLVPGFTLGARLGFGGFGSVYVGKDHAGVERAIKILNPTRLAPQANARDRFAREAQSLRQLKHANVVEYVLLAETNRFLYLVMEYVRGRPLGDWAREQPNEARVGAVITLLDALSYLHGKGVFHRDIKPANIVVEETTGRPVLVDFGLAWITGLVDTAMTRESTWSVAYAPPEVLQDPRNSRGPNHDIYSVGVVLYELLASRRPSLTQRLPLAEVNPELEILDPIISRALAPEAGRYQSAAEFAQALRDAASGQQPWWDEAIATAATLRHPVLSNLVGGAARAGAEDDLSKTAMTVAAIFEALRIHWTRAYRTARGSDAPGMERWLPARFSPSAARIFHGAPSLWQEPKLAEDKYGEAAVQALGFPLSELAALRQVVRAADIAAGQPKREDESDVVDEGTIAVATTALARRLLLLEQNEVGVMREFARLCEEGLKSQAKRQAD